MRIQVCDGKYTFVFESLKLSVLRYGEPWLENAIQGERAIIGLMHKVQELVREGKEFEKLFVESIDPKTEKVSLSYTFLKALLERHVSDQMRIAELEDALEKAKEALAYAGGVLNTDGEDPIDKAKDYAEKVLRNGL
jgi:hypothetical protein